MTLWEETVKFHGHQCGGLTWGYKVALFALEKLNFDRASDEELVVIVENDSCAVDAIQYVTGCTFGKGNFIFKDYGKHVYTFFNRNTGQSIRISRKKGTNFDDIMSAKGEDLFEVSEPKEEIPKRARIHKSIECSRCGESAMETRIHILDGKHLCEPCYQEITNK
ncbi:formylmethanofuran dehydrogenase [Candidatus Poribacteria bacterium]|nr:formylmethanofuran dehydrogenase [Candidatus Poribacteria bacterium]